MATREEVTKRDPRSTADIIVAGDDPSRGLALADSRRFKQLLDELRASYDLIVIDSRPVFDLADANIFTAVADATLMIVQWGSTPRRVFLYSIEKIAQLGGRIDGIVISKIDVKRYTVYGYGDLIERGGASIGHRSTLLRFGLVTAGITALAAGVVAWQLTRPYLVPSENHAELPAPSPSLVEPDPSPMPEPTSGEPPVTQPMTSGDSVTAVDRPALKSEVAPVPAAMAPESSTPPTPSEEPDSSTDLTREQAPAADEKARPRTAIGPPQTPPLTSPAARFYRPHPADTSPSAEGKVTGFGAPAAIEVALARGNDLMTQSDVVSARFLYGYAVTRGSVAAMTAMGRTYDPVFFTRSGTRGVRPEPVKAIKWYERAIDGGDAEAKRHLRELVLELRDASGLDPTHAAALLRKTE